MSNSAYQTPFIFLNIKLIGQLGIVNINSVKFASFILTATIFSLHLLLIKIINTFAVNITFADRKFEIIVNDDKKLLKEYGKEQAGKIRTRLAQLKAAITLEDVRNLPGRFHELRENRKGQWGCDLVQPDRLVFIPHENPIPVNEHGQYIWLEITGVEIIEVINYHKEK